MLEMVSQTQQPLPRSVVVRAALPADVPVIAELLLEGFGHEYGGLLRKGAGRRFVERVHALPGRLSGMAVAVDPTNKPIGVAGLRTREMYPRADGGEERAMFEELGFGMAMLLDVRAALTEPLPYQPERREAYIYSVAVAISWRGQGIGDALLDWLHERALRLGKNVAVLEVAEHNKPARRLYDRHGYAIVRRRRGLLAWFPGGVQPMLLMRRTLLPA